MSAGPAATRVWRVTASTGPGGGVPRPLGAPRTEQTPVGEALCFDGKDDGLVLENNPLAGMAQFTLQVLFRPDADGPAEQRFVHLQESGSENRAMVETRVTPEGRWYLDTFLKSADDSHALIDEKLQHPADRWYWAALSYDGETMRHYVSGALEGEATVRFRPLGPGRMSVGMRLNEVHWFKGCIAEFRYDARALPPGELKTAPPATVP